MQNNNNQIVKKESFSAFINSKGSQQAIKNTLQDTVKCQRFTASIISAVSVNPALKECEPSSVLTGALIGEALNLSPSPQLGHYYLVPFKNKKTGTSQAQFILGYKGYVQLAIRSGQYKAINVIEVREGEYKGLDRLTGEAKIEFIEDDKERLSKEVVGYYAYIKLTSGFEKTLYWSKEKMLKHADTYSQAFSASAYQQIKDGKVSDKDMWKYSSFWYRSFDDMSFKTLLRQIISKWGVMSIEMRDAYTADETYGDSLNNRHYMDAEYKDTDIKAITQEQQAQIKEALAEVKEESAQPDNNVNVDDFIKNDNQENNDDVFNNF